MKSFLFSLWKHQVMKHQHHRPMPSTNGMCLLPPGAQSYSPSQGNDLSTVPVESKVNRAHLLTLAKKAQHRNYTFLKKKKQYVKLMICSINRCTRKLIVFRYFLPWMIEHSWKHINITERFFSVVKAKLIFANILKMSVTGCGLWLSCREGEEQWVQSVVPEEADPRSWPPSSYHVSPIRVGRWDLSTELCVAVWKLSDQCSYCKDNICG